MRTYVTFDEAQNEIRRDLKELGVKVHTQTMQDKNIADDPNYETYELANYIYTVTRPDYTDITDLSDDWVRQEWEDRLIGGLNPGRAWKLRKDVWLPFLYKTGGYHGTHGRFSYTYSDRMGGNHLQYIVQELKTHPESRQLYLPVWDRNVDERRRGVHRVPCSLGYWFVQRRGELHLTYMMRSCDFATHFANDIALANIMQHYVAGECGYKVGSFTHFVGSFHVYEKDVADVF